MSEKRVQFTPDLMPADILGSEVLDETPGGQRAFRFIPGPVFAQLLMADEINRASPRTQAALLQAMQERKVTVAGQDHVLPAPFHVLATQNPIEQEGTYPLPEAQLDRFLMQVDVAYPGSRPSGDDDRDHHRAGRAARGRARRPTLMAMQRLVRRMPIGDKLVDLILRLVRAGRPENRELPDIAEQVSWGPGPRASQR
jgi:MoxR-like ATPase